jgi:hypothetical protein
MKFPVLFLKLTSRGNFSADAEGKIPADLPQNAPSLRRPLLIWIRSPADQLQVVAIPPFEIDKLQRRDVSHPTVLPPAKAKPRKRSRLPKPQIRWEKLSGCASLISLALGFPILGILSLLNRPRPDLMHIATDATFCNVAGVASMLVGGLFLVVALLYSNRL